MSKSGSTKFRWVDEYDDGSFSRDGKRRKNKKDNNDHRAEKRQKNALKARNFEYFNEDE